ncbi:MAG TPA: hypothetical protein VKU84_14500 [Stellaceae bacterium]|nr:hypothetical protein [Stellaceae bacterium]
MARRKSRYARDEETMHPAPERWARGEVERLPTAIADEQGRPARPYRATDTLLVMERRGTITSAMRQAAEDFRAIFYAASLDPLRAPDLNRIASVSRDPFRGERGGQAREQVWAAMTALGGIQSPAGSCVWHVVGCEWTLKDWALREGWGGRPLGVETAAGVLVGALGVLQGLYGL